MTGRHEFKNGVTHTIFERERLTATLKYANCSVRTPSWHLLSFSKGTEKNWALFDVAADAEEQKDVAVQHPEIVAQMHASFETWWTSVQPMLVNEQAIGPAINPFKPLYWKQFGKSEKPRKKQHRTERIRMLFLCD